MSFGGALALRETGGILPVAGRAATFHPVGPC
jgi:hypothetical protein